MIEISKNGTSDKELNSFMTANLKPVYKIKNVELLSNGLFIVKDDKLGVVPVARLTGAVKEKEDMDRIISIATEISAKIEILNNNKLKISNRSIYVDHDKFLAIVGLIKTYNISDLKSDRFVELKNNIKKVVDKKDLHNFIEHYYDVESKELIQILLEEVKHKVWFLFLDKNYTANMTEKDSANIVNNGARIIFSSGIVNVTSDGFISTEDQRTSSPVLIARIIKLRDISVDHRIAKMSEGPITKENLEENDDVFSIVKRISRDINRTSKLLIDSGILMSADSLYKYDKEFIVLHYAYEDFKKVTSNQFKTSLFQELSKHGIDSKFFIDKFIKHALDKNLKMTLERSLLELNK